MAAESNVAREPRRLVVLDALRGLSALVVLWHHVMTLNSYSLSVWRDGSPVTYALAQFVSDQNKRAVLLFFVLSGLAIGLSLREPPLGRNGVATYARRRAQRILPLYWLALLWTALLGYIAGRLDQSFSLGNLLGNLLFLQTPAASSGSWFVPYGENGPLWSLSFEVFYYLLIPVIFAILPRLWISKPNVWIYVTAFACLASLASIGMRQIIPFPPLSFLSLWLVWMLGFLISDRYRSGQSMLVVLAFIVPVAGAQTFLGVLGYTSATINLLVDGTVIAAVVALGFASARRLPSLDGVLSSQAVRGLVIVGHGSYALYLFHYPLLQLAAQGQHKLAATQFAGLYWPLLSVVLIAFACYACPKIEDLIQRAIR